LIGVGVSGFQEGARQMSLWEQPDERSERLHAVAQALRKRYGEQALRRGSELRK
jgi:alkanesulfonate monooxygenase SsuD/methylene tetrahydromethanopterin reductase-like flavin-dependent oxidoreductase (luciferase family)